MNTVDLITGSCDDYELIDFGDKEKLERIGNFFIIRPDQNAIGIKSNPDSWNTYDAKFIEESKTWELLSKIPTKFFIKLEQAKLELRLGQFKNIGVFFEQSSHVKNLAQINQDTDKKLLNLFGYTGFASIAASRAGFKVTHVDSSNPTLQWFKENLKINEITNIKFFSDDAVSFILKEAKQGNDYDVIIADPPVFGRSQNKIWKLDKHFDNFINTLAKITSKNFSEVIINIYKLNLNTKDIASSIENAFNTQNTTITTGRLGIQSTSNKILYQAHYFKIIRI